MSIEEACIDGGKVVDVFVQSGAQSTLERLGRHLHRFTPCALTQFAEILADLDANHPLITEFVRVCIIRRHFPHNTRPGTRLSGDMEKLQNAVTSGDRIDHHINASQGGFPHSYCAEKGLGPHREAWLRFLEQEVTAL